MGLKNGGINTEHGTHSLSKINKCKTQKPITNTQPSVECMLPPKTLSMLASIIILYIHYSLTVM